MKLLLTGVLLTGLAGAANAALIDVSDMSITGFSFELLPTSGSGFLAATAENTTIAADTDLVDGAREGFLSFDLTVDFVVRTEEWKVVADTTAASPASIDTVSNEFTIDLGTFNTDWDSTIRCGDMFPSCADVEQGPAAGTVTGSWNPVTHEFEISWQRLIESHPFPGGIGSWTIYGVAQPVPVPGALVLFASGVLGLMGLARRKAA